MFYPLVLHAPSPHTGQFSSEKRLLLQLRVASRSPLIAPELDAAAAVADILVLIWDTGRTPPDLPPTLRTESCFLLDQAASGRRASRPSSPPLSIPYQTIRLKETKNERREAAKAWSHVRLADVRCDGHFVKQTLASGNIFRFSSSSTTTTPRPLLLLLPPAAVLGQTGITAGVLPRRFTSRISRSDVDHRRRRNRWPRRCGYCSSPSS